MCSSRLHLFNSDHACSHFATSLLLAFACFSYFIVTSLFRFYLFILRCEALSTEPSTVPICACVFSIPLFEVSFSMCCCVTLASTLRFCTRCILCRLNIEIYLNVIFYTDTHAIGRRCSCSHFRFEFACAMFSSECLISARLKASVRLLPVNKLMHTPNGCKLLPKAAQPRL